MPKIPGQKPARDDISRNTRDKIMGEVKKAWSSDTCTATPKEK